MYACFLLMVTRFSFSCNDKSQGSGFFETRCTGCANKKQSPRKNSISGIVADFFTRFMLFTEEDLGHVSSKLHLNIWFDSEIITI